MTEDNIEITEDVGIIVGRFQVHDLHEGHREIIEMAMRKHKRVIIFLGISAVPTTKRNPLDFFSRKLMIEKRYPQITVLPIHDMRSDFVWSYKLDERISEITKNETVLLYGGRDSFIRFYHGLYSTSELEPSVFTSGSEIRKEIKNETRSSPDFRAGVIYSTYHVYDSVHPTIDVAIVKEDSQLLLAKKPGEERWRFVGGFIDIKDSCAEFTVRREVSEETGVEIDGVKYISSALVNDWRYKNETDKIMTFFYYARYIYGQPRPDDDIEKLKWFNFDELSIDLFVEEHHTLYHDFKKYMNITKGDVE